MQAGVVAAATVNVWRAKKDRPLSAIDFVPDWTGERRRGEGRRRELTVEESVEAARGLAEALGVVSERKKGEGGGDGDQHR